MKENINALNELNKGACMGMDAIDCIIDKIDNPKFKNTLKKQYKDYKNISLKINKIYNTYDQKDDPQETSTMNKVMTWYGVEMRTMLDHSDSKIAELLLQGTNMGIIEGRKIFNNKKIDKEVRDIVNEYVTMQEEIVECLKNYL